MKNIIFNILLFIGLTCFAQNSIIPKLNFQGSFDTPNNYIKLLNIEDKDALIIKFTSKSIWHASSNVIVFQNNGMISRYVLNSNDKVDRQKVEEKNFKLYWDFLNDSAAKNKFEIDKSKLNIISKPLENGQQSTMTVSDGETLTVEIWQGNQYISYSSYSPQTYIEHKFPGYQERQKLVDLLKDLYKLVGQK